MNQLTLSNQSLDPVKLRFFLKHLSRAAKQPRKPIEIAEKMDKKEALKLYKRYLTIKVELDKLKNKKKPNKKDIEKLTKKIKSLGSRLKQQPL